ncbi:hypothetical protein RFI_27391 [Reticulomyxa filosa]|uniref:PIH1D1/2/3 CS-like domain-containing protein n=1 Tax=Reticulomyxa filosa TaxID=46433 RepID=X6M936_RETFI|nr:hypothetical protein RFI_27391 [Reticulomyxa filosa]|eukprot:ETO09987.1 hypothetical protein RFI_27391 [Reticulomyxa filosa]
MCSFSVSDLEALSNLFEECQKYTPQQIKSVECEYEKGFIPPKPIPEEQKNSKVVIKSRRPLVSLDETNKENTKAKQEPKYELIYRQNVTLDEVYGYSEKANTTLDCEDLLVRVHLPDELISNITLKVETNSLTVATLNYYLQILFPRNITKLPQNAKWIKEKSVLEILCSLEKI